VSSANEPLCLPQGPRCGGSHNFILTFDGGSLPSGERRFSNYVFQIVFWHRALVLSFSFSILFSLSLSLSHSLSLSFHTIYSKAEVQDSFKIAFESVSDYCSLRLCARKWRAYHACVCVCVCIYIYIFTSRYRISYPLINYVSKIKVSRWNELVIDYVSKNEWSL